MSDREEFEKALAGEVSLRKDKDGSYTWREAQAAWLGWQAASAQSGQGAEPVGYLHNRPERIPCFFESYDEAMLNGCEVVPVYTRPQPAQQGVPEGWKLVPVEPTTEMRYAYHEAEQRYLEGSIPSPDGQWLAMLDAAPQPPQEGE